MVIVVLTVDTKFPLDDMRGNRSRPGEKQIHPDAIREWERKGSRREAEGVVEAPENLTHQSQETQEDSACSAPLREFPSMSGSFPGV